MLVDLIINIANIIIIIVGLICVLAIYIDLFRGDKNDN